MSTWLFVAHWQLWDNANRANKEVAWEHSNVQGRTIVDCLHYVLKCEAWSASLVILTWISIRPEWSWHCFLIIAAETIQMSCSFHSVKHNSYHAHCQAIIPLYVHLQFIYELCTLSHILDLKFTYSLVMLFSPSWFDHLLYKLVLLKQLHKNKQTKRNNVLKF